MAALPPRPWAWHQVASQALPDEDLPSVPVGRGRLILVAEDGTRLLWCGSGGRLEVHPALRELVPLLAPDPADLGGAVVEAEVAVGLLAEVRRLTAERDQARALAWSYEHRMFDYAAIGIALDQSSGEPIEPAWLSSPVAPYEDVLDADLASFSSDGYGTVYGEQVAALRVGDYAWVTDRSGAPDDVDAVYVQVREVGDGLVHVQLLTDPTDVLHAP
jgi:hypothetical protein